MKSKAHAVLIHPESPEVLFAMLKDYLQTYGKMRMLFASSVSYGHFGFLEVVAISKKDKKESRLFSIPVQNILAIADLPEPLGKKERWGFQQIGRASCRE